MKIRTQNSFFKSILPAVSFGALTGVLTSLAVNLYKVCAKYVMAFSEKGAAHFADCKFLFDLNGTVLLLSSACLLALFFLRKKLGPYKLGKRSAAFYAGIGAVVLPLVAGGLAATDFDRAFVVFHQIFFPGKDNWIFDYRTDEIIRVLPQDFFMHCAILIAAGVLILSASVLIWEFARKKSPSEPALST
jgi:integral membrane protein (TIGR01906 family)